MAGVADKLRGPGKGPSLRDMRAAAKALIGAGCPVENIEIQVTANGAFVRAKHGGEPQSPKAAKDAADVVAERLR